MLLSWDHLLSYDSIVGVQREVALFVVVAICGVGALRVRRMRIAPGLWTALSVGAAARIVVAVLAQPFTPHDVARLFALVGREVLAGRDPALAIPGRRWNFLPVMPYLWAALLKTGLPWTIGMKIIPIGSDLVNIWLVGLLCKSDLSRPAVRLSYALNPLAIVIVSVHGQVEPTALMFLLAGMVLLARMNDLGAGLFFGLAIACKTWPVLVVIPVLAAMPKRALKPILGVVAIVGAFFVSSVVFLGSSPVALERKLTSYGSFVGFWGWAGSVASFGNRSVLGYDSSVSRLGTLLVALVVIATLVLFRDADPLRRAWTTPMACLAVTAGFGPQYLMWPAPFLTANEERQNPYLVR